MAEQSSASLSYLAERLQHRKQAGISAPLMAVPSSLGPVGHFEEGLVAPSPINVPPSFPQDLEFAVSKVLELGDNIDSWRESQNG